MPDPNNIALPDYGLAFVCTPKAANTSIKLAIYKALGINPPMVHHHWPREPAKIWNPPNDQLVQYHTIMFVREPLDRLISFYRDKVVCNRFGQVSRRCGVRESMSLFEFADLVANTPDDYADQHWRQQSYGLPSIDFVGSFHYLMYDWGRVRRFCRGRGLYLPVLPHTNKSDPGSVMVTHRLIKLVHGRYRQDYELFHSQFEHRDIL